jgi:RNA polymerase sigma factor (sigma-70 family)
MSTFLARSQPLTYDGHSDPELVQMCVDGDRPAWDALILRYNKLIYSIAVDFGFNESDSRDVVQNVCLKLYKGLHSLRESGKVYAWLMTTTKRECLDLAERKQRDVVPEGETEEPADPARTLEEIMISAEKQQGVREAVGELAPPCGPLLQMLYFEERTYKEAAARLAVPLDGMGARQARCLEKLRSRIAERGITSL